MSEVSEAKKPQFDLPSINVVKEAQKLIAIPSVTGNEGRIGEYLHDRFRELGCDTRLIEAAPGRYNVTAFWPGQEMEPGLLFHGHLDTIPVYNMEKPFEPLIRDGHIWGRGSVDQKGGIAAALAAFSELIAGGKPLRCGVAFVGVIDEESEHRGSMMLESMNIKAKQAIVTEPTGLKVGLGCKGSIPFTVTVKGKASHGCRPWLGVNAVEYGMKIAAELLAEELPVFKPKGLDQVQASLNLGLMNGGVAYNRVPDECELCFDRRLVPGEDQNEIIQGIRKIAGRYEQVEGLEISVEIARPDWNWQPIMERGLKPAVTDRGEPIVAAVINAHRQVTGEEQLLYFTDGYNEMDFLINDLGIPTVQYGPGDSSLCHTDLEKLDIEQLTGCASVYLRAILDICGGIDEH